MPTGFFAVVGSSLFTFTTFGRAYAIQVGCGGCCDHIGEALEPMRIGETGLTRIEACRICSFTIMVEASCEPTCEVLASTLIASIRSTDQRCENCGIRTFCRG